MLYDPHEISTSSKQLATIFKQLAEPACLLGGWATYHLVGQNFESATGRQYIGSRDIDLGFHIDKHWTEEHLRTSAFMTAMKTLESMGFTSVSFRLVKDFDLDTGRELAPDESAKLPLYRIFQLYVDPVVDYIHPEIKNLVGFTPIDEPLLSLIFQDRMYTATTLFECARAATTPCTAGNEAQLGTPPRQRKQKNQRHCRHLRPSVVLRHRPVPTQNPAHLSLSKRKCETDNTELHTR